MSDIETQAYTDTAKAYSSDDVHLPYCYCTSCRPGELKRPCVVSVVDGTALCSYHFFEKRKKELERAAEAARQAKKLDVEDFARI